MKRVIHTLLTLLLLIVITMNASAQRADLRAMSGDIFYWFNVKISNSIDRDTLLDAQAHPERHRHLIVRVWGWSGYFVELDKGYQDHIIRRTEMTING